MDKEKNIAVSNWKFWRSKKRENDGIYYKYEQAYCGIHGVTEHVRVGENILCRACAAQYEKKKALEVKKEVKTPLIYV
jgi:hypothetical protein